MRDYTQIPLGLHITPKDSRDWELDKFMLAEGQFREIYPEVYELPFKTPVLDQGRTSMCADYTYRTIEEIQWVTLGNGYKEFANGYRYGQKLFPDIEGMMEAFEVDSYVKGGIPFAEDFNVVGTSAQCKEYFDLHNSAELKSKARLHRNAYYVSVKTCDEIVRSLINFNSAGSISVTIYDNFYESQKNGGIVPTASGNRRGGHLMAVVGVVNIAGKRYIKVKNSWGVDYGDGGYIYIEDSNPCIQNIRMFTDAAPVNEELRLSIGDPVVVSLKSEITMDVAPFIQNSRTFVPLRFVSEVLGYDVEWLEGQGTKKQGLVIVRGKKKEVL